MGTIDIIGSQLDVASIVSQLMLLERQPVYRMEDQVASMQTKVNAYQEFNTKLSALANSVNKMLYGTSYAPMVLPASFNDRLTRSMFTSSTAKSSNENVLTATAFGGGYTAQGSYSITVRELAKAHTSISTWGVDAVNKDIGKITGTITFENITDTDGDPLTIGINLDSPAKAQVWTSAEIGSGETPFTGTGTGTITFKTNDGSKTIDINVNSLTSLHDLENVIDGNQGFAAAVVNNQLVVTAPGTGTDNAFSVEFTGNNLSLHEGLGAKAVITQAENNGNTLSGLQQAINDAASKAGVGINALITNDGANYKLMIVSKETGEINQFSVALESDNWNGSGPETLDFNDAQIGRDAVFTINNIVMTSSSNTLKSVIEGVTIELKNVTQPGEPGKPGETVKLDLGVDEDAIVESIKDVIAAYNEVVKFINSQFSPNINLVNTSNSSDFIKSQFKTSDVTTGVLAGDTTLRSVQSRLQEIIMGSMLPEGESTGFRSMRSFGITAERDGTLSLDESELKKALSDDLEGTAKFFLGTAKIGSDGKVVASSGMLSNMGTALKGLTDPLGNPIKGAMDGLTSTINNVMKNIESYELRLQAKEDMLYAQFAAADQALRQMRVLLGSIGSSLASLSNMNNN